MLSGLISCIEPPSISRMREKDMRRWGIKGRMRDRLLCVALGTTLGGLGL